jgi:hypothetical protein
MTRPTHLRLLVGVAMLAGVAGVAVATAADRPRGRNPRGARLPVAVTTPPPGPVMDVPPVDRAARPAVARAAAAIDRLLADRWREHGVRPSPPLTDSQFVRRAYLEIGGRIPSHDETVAFLGDESADKRAALVDRLLGSPDFVSHFYNFWADILRLTERPQRQLPFEPYLDSVKQAIRTNKPYDDWVRELLTADGRLWENPAVGFQLRDAGMPLPYVDNTVRVFLGTQIGCAQCHDHPFDQWTQRQFYELAAFTAGTRMRPGAGKAAVTRGGRRERPPSAVAALVREAKETKGKKAGPLVNFIQANATVVSFAPRKLGLPHDPRDDDSGPPAPVTPRVPWGAVPAEAAHADGRQQFAAWLVDRDNRQFARTIANRLWRKLMGGGLVEPVDDFRDENPPSDPELLERLTDLVLDLDFDLREFVRVIVATDVWSRRAVVHDPASGSPFRFPGPALKRMTAEQLWDSILVLVARNPWAVQRPTAGDIAAVASVDLEHATLADVEARFDDFMERFGPARYQRSLQRTCGYRGQLLMRASEMPTPLPLGHFLRQFGQSDRETIEGGRTVATVPQILAMFNGPITHAMLEQGSVIYDEVTSHESAEAIDVVFLSVLSRRPSAEDRTFAFEELRTAEDFNTGCGNLIWALLNTREFIFIQ